MYSTFNGIEILFFFSFIHEMPSIGLSTTRGERKIHGMSWLKRNLFRLHSKKKYRRFSVRLVSNHEIDRIVCVSAINYSSSRICSSKRDSIKIDVFADDIVESLGRPQIFAKIIETYVCLKSQIKKQNHASVRKLTVKRLQKDIFIAFFCFCRGIRSCVIVGSNDIEVDESWLIHSIV